MSDTEREEVGVVAQRALDPGNPAHAVKLLGVSGFFTVRGTRDQKVAAIAERQRGRVSRRQLLAAGINEGVIERMLSNGRLHRLHAGVYAVGHLAPVELGRETAALLAVPVGGAVLSFHAAAALWGLRPRIGPREPIDITVLGGRCVNRAGIRAHRTACLDERDVRIHQRLPVTSPARTLLDMGGVVTIDELEQQLDDGLVNNVVRVDQVAEVVDRGGHGRNRTAPLRALLEERLERPSTSRSRYERILRRLIRTAQLPEPEMNVQLHGYTVDCVWRELRLVVEVDSYTYHGSRAMFESDRRRDAVLEAAGWTVIRITRRQLEHEPYAVIATLAQALSRAQTARAA